MLKNKCVKTLQTLCVLLVLNGCTLLTHFEDYRFDDANDSSIIGDSGSDSAMVGDTGNNSMLDSGTYEDAAPTEDSGLTNRDSSWVDSGQTYNDAMADSAIEPVSCYNRPCETGTCTRIPCPIGSPGICMVCL